MNLLIVDDETTTRNGLVRHINWTGFGISRIELASSGAEALERCSVFAPDIVLSDIRMPEMSGIELCRRLRSQYPECVILFLSGYSDKEYLHSAIDLGAVDYIEKPFDITSVYAAAKKATDIASRKRQHNQSYGAMHRALSHHMPVIRRKVVDSLITPNTNPEQYKSDLELLDVFSNSNQWFTVLILQYPHAVKDMEACELTFLHSFSGYLSNFEYLHAFKDGQHQIIILAASEPGYLPHRSCLQDLSTQIAVYHAEEMPVFCAVGSCVHTIGSISVSYADAVIALQKLFFSDYGQTICCTEEPIQSLVFNYDYLDHFSQLLILMEYEEAQLVLESVYQQLAAQKATFPAHIRSIYQKIGYMILEKKQKAHPDQHPLELFSQKPSDTATLKELHDYYSMQLNPLIEENLSDNNRRIVSQIMKYVQTHFQDSQLSVKSISKIVYLSPNYLSNLFKRERGQSLIEYIRDVRVKSSLPLLCDNSLKLYHIALKVGFTDANYYAKMFKKVMGITPSEYKEHQGL